MKILKLILRSPLLIVVSPFMFFGAFFFWAFKAENVSLMILDDLKQAWSL